MLITGFIIGFIVGAITVMCWALCAAERKENEEKGRRTDD